MDKKKYWAKRWLGSPEYWIVQSDNDTTLFLGPLCEDRAKEYAAFKNSEKGATVQ